MGTFIAGMSSASYYATLNNMGSVDIYNVKSSTYGAKGDGITDDTIAIQAAINAAYTAGGGEVYFPRGIYIIGGALQTNVGGINYKSQLYIPNIDVIEPARTCVTLKGEVCPNFMQFAGVFGAYDPLQTTKGVILKSTLESATALSYVIASKGAAGNAIAGMNYNQCNIEDISIHITANAGKALTLGGIGFNDAANTVIKNVCVFPSAVNPHEYGEPINNCVGIAMPAVNCEHLSIIENCTVGGFESGFLLGDHSAMKNLSSICCKYGYNFGANNLIAHGMKIGAYWCANSIYFSGVSYVKIDNFQEEWYHNGDWYESLYTILDASNQGHGEIYYNIAESFVGFNNARFAKSGGANLQCMPIAFASAASFTVTGADDLAGIAAALKAKGIITY
jgi:hypothetical protein